jgi:hypothetical protein
VTDKFTRASQSKGIFLEMGRAPIDRNIRAEAFQILQLEIKGRKGATVGQYLTLKVLEKFNLIGCTRTKSDFG